MELLNCRHCGSNLINLIAVSVKHQEDVERNVNIKKNYISTKDPQAVKHFLRCFNCGKISELVLKNQRGCCSIEQNKNCDKTPRNEIIGVQEIF